MKDQKAVRVVLCLVCMGLSVCLTGCSISFCGFRPGKGDELVFTCQEELPDPEEGMTAVQIPDRKEEESSAGTEEGAANSASEESGSSSAGGETASETTRGAGTPSDGRVNINTAGMEELMTLNGIGETRARAIVEYRIQNGPFTKAEDIMQIPGIKEGIYSKIQDQIIVQ